MFVKSTLEVGITQRVVATLVACAVVMATIGFYNTAQAANLTDVSNTLTDSAPSVTSGHTIEFTVPTGSSIGPTEAITVTFDSQDEGAVGQAFTGITGTAAGNVTVSGGGAFDSNTADTLVVDGVTAAAGATVTIEVADGIITNPAKENAAGVGDSYEISISIANAGTDLGRTRVVVIDTVEVTAEVATQFEFEVRPVASGVTVNGETTDEASSSTTIPFGELTAGTPKFIAQQLSVVTNSNNGFVVTVEKDGELRSSTGANINTYLNGTDVIVPGGWAAPLNTLNSPDTYGHWGMTTEDGDVNDVAAPTFAGTDEFVAVLDTPQTIFGHDAVCDGLSTGAGTAGDDDECLTEVGYKIQIGALQEAGDDYNTTLTYIATPTF